MSNNTHDDANDSNSVDSADLNIQHGSAPPPTISLTHYNPKGKHFDRIRKMLLDIVPAGTFYAWIKWNGISYVFNLKQEVTQTNEKAS